MEQILKKAIPYKCVYEIMKALTCKSFQHNQSLYLQRVEKSCLRVFQDKFQIFFFKGQ
jgi:hypothetical protein